jgi:hypothetical protein
MLPTFIVIGSTKSGSTSLYQYLHSHPQIFMSETKELRFFSSPERWRLGVSWYEKQFKDAGDAVARGEVSPQYTRYPEVPDVPRRMASVVPAARLVYLIRDPIERLQSQYRYRVLRGQEHRPIDVAVVEDPKYVDGSRYAMQLDQYVSHFDPSSIHVLTAEALRADRSDTMRKVYAFVGADPELAPDGMDREYNRVENKRSYTKRSKPVRVLTKQAVAVGLPISTAFRLSTKDVDRPDGIEEAVVSDEVRARLRDELRDDAVRLREWLGADFDAWGLDGS